LLDERKWPAYVAICEWFFKPKKTENMDAVAATAADQTKKRRIDHGDDCSTSVKSIADQPSVSYADIDWTWTQQSCLQ